MLILRTNRKTDRKQASTLRTLGRKLGGEQMYDCFEAANYIHNVRAELESDVKWLRKTERFGWENYSQEAKHTDKLELQIKKLTTKVEKLTTRLKKKCLTKNSKKI